jgi:uracil-DNA glycosylase
MMAQFLEQLWNDVDAIHRRNFPASRLMPIVGNGKTNRPDVMFVFINPTIRNSSSDPSWKGPRFPFIGTKQVWRIFHRAGFFDDALMQEIEKNKSWSLDLTTRVLAFLRDHSIYLTNIVKWTGEDATLPDAKKIKLFLPILQEEIGIVKPRRIVTFGLIPFAHLTKETIKLKEYYEQSIKRNSLQEYKAEINGAAVNVIPCYFPIGRGDPKRAVELLRLLKKTS